MKLGIDRLLTDTSLRARLKGKRIAFLGHSASNSAFTSVGWGSSLQALRALPELQVVSAWGPQHGFKTDKQYNMIETPNEVHQGLGIPIYSLYGESRRPTPKMVEECDVVLIDLQDLGTRIFTYLTTMTYVLEACAAAKGKEVWILDRPNPAGRPVEGFKLQKGQESFVGCGPIPMRHGLTLGEAALWYKKYRSLDVHLEIIGLEGYDPQQGPGYGWPMKDLPWVNPSPNAASLNMARCYPGTVLLEGTLLSEGRGTTVPLEVIGAPDLEIEKLIAGMQKEAPDWLGGCWIRPCYFEPTTYKHQGALCSGIQIHTDIPSYVHSRFKPYRLVALFLKVLKKQQPDYPLWRTFVYEYEKDRLPFDVINGGPRLREWIEDSEAEAEDLEAMLKVDERAWEDERRQWLRY